MDLITKADKGKTVTIVGFWINMFLGIIKITAGIFGKSGAIIADGIHSLSDFITDVIVLFGLKYSKEKDDERHNYGHSKFESLSTFIIGLILGFTGYEILKYSVSQIYNYFLGIVLVRPNFIAVFAAVLSIVFKEMLFRYTIKVGKEINSSSVVANAWHHRSDVYSSLATVAGVSVASLLGNKFIILDPLASLLVSGFIFKIAIDTIKPALRELTDESLDSQEIAYIKNYLDNYKRIISYHKLRTRRAGEKTIIDLHISLSKEISFDEAHYISDVVENELLEHFGKEALITIHIDPV